MSKIYINDEHEIEGKVSVGRKLQVQGEDIDVITTGQLATSTYIENIYKVETSRFIVHDVFVHQENFGSEDDLIIYSFDAERIEVLEKEGDVLE